MMLGTFASLVVLFGVILHSSMTFANFGGQDSMVAQDRVAMIKTLQSKFMEQKSPDSILLAIRDSRTWECREYSAVGIQSMISAVVNSFSFTKDSVYQLKLYKGADNYVYQDKRDASVDNFKKQTAAFSIHTEGLYSTVNIAANTPEKFTVVRASSSDEILIETSQHYAQFHRLFAYFAKKFGIEIGNLVPSGMAPGYVVLTYAQCRATPSP